MSRFITGLVVGKFCPLHRGHQWLLDHAQAQCERLVVISYTRPEFAGCEPERRERWLAALYPDAQRLVLDDARLREHCLRAGVACRAVPHNDADGEVHRDFVDWLLHAVLGVCVDAVFTSEDYGDGFAIALSKAQRGRGGPAVVHVPVDPGRIAVPVSGTAVRADLHAHRHLLEPLVHRDFVQRVALLGGESTGKSTLSVRLAERLGTIHAAEYGRERWEERGGELAQADMPVIARTQVEREETLLRDADRWLICDTTPLTTLLYSQAMFGQADDELHRLARRAYDHVFLCAPDFPFVQDGTRRDDAFRQWQHAWYVRELDARGIGFHLLRGDIAFRIATAVALLEAGARATRRYETA